MNHSTDSNSQKEQATLSRRSLIKTAISGSVGLATLPIMQMATAQSDRTIQGQMAPELTVSHWIDGEGKPTKPFSVAEHRGKWVYLKCFQEWCPACHSVGFPNLQKLVEAFPNNEKVVPAVIQTVFEGHSFNTTKALRKNQLRYDLALPFGHDIDDVDLPRGDPGRYPSTMVSYRTGGTPWVVIISPEGQVMYDGFHINIDELINYLKEHA